jgi:hypothetical protein
MTPHYSWTPASEPPDTMRRVLVISEHAPDGWDIAYYYHTRGQWFWNASGIVAVVTHWRDVSPPDVEPPK